MKKILSFLIFSFSFVNAQIDLPKDFTRSTPSAASFITYGDIKVDKFTGTPNVSVPLYSFSTRSKDISIPIGLSYHPQNINLWDKASDVGLGWSLFCGGIVTRTIVAQPDEMYKTVLTQVYVDPRSQFNDVYYFNVNGIMGNFLIVPNTNDSGFSVQLMQSNAIVIVEANVNPQSYDVDSFKITDDNGYQYFFAIYDEFVEKFDVARAYPSPGNPTNSQPISYRSSHHLTKITDNNGKDLALFTYNSYNTNTNLPTEYDNSIKKINQVTVPGLGSAIFSYQLIPSLYKHNDVLQLNQVEIKNYTNEFISRFNLEYGFSIIPSHQTPDNVFKKRRMLAVVRQFSSDNQSQNHSFEYENRIPANLSINDYVFGTDVYGFLNMHLNCDVYNGATYWEKETVTPNYVTHDVLKKITYPTGGCSIFNFESNTFSLQNINPNTEVTPECYKKNEVDNINQTLFATSSFNATTSITSFTFTVTAYDEYFFSFTSAPITYPPGLTPPGDNPPNAGVSYKLKYANPDLNYYVIADFDNFNIESTLTISCLGKLVKLMPGTYKIEYATSTGTTNGSINIYRKQLKPQISQWLYGGGVRVRKIANFKEQQLADYFDNLNQYSTITPVSVKNYNYQFSATPNKSSGFKSYATSGQMTVAYREVTESETPYLGKVVVEYAFPNPAEYNQTTLTWNNILGYKDGLPLTSKTYDKNNRILSQINNSYTFYQVNNQLFNTIWGFDVSNECDFTDYPLGSGKTTNVWAALTSSSTKNYFYESNGTQRFIELLETTSYNQTNRQVSEKVIQNLTDSSSALLKTKYYYHTGNSSLSQNRICEIEKVETYRNNTLLSTSQLLYANNWGAANVSFLPHILQSSKSNLALENRHRITAYDEFSNPTEIIMENGMTTTYLWGYQKTSPIAKIVNATNAQVAGALGVSSVHSLTEANLTAINNLRTNPTFVNAFVTTYTYKPMVGMLTMTDPKNDKITFVYDTFNRLIETRDKDNNLITENTYEINQSNALNSVLSKAYKVASTTSLPVTSDNVVVSKSFFDGLGRTLQKIDYRQTATGKDIITPIAYDDETKIHPKTYLPYATTGNSLSYNPNAISEQALFSKYVGQVAFSEQLLEESPLGTLLKESAPGTTWAMGSGKEIKKEQLLNNTNDQVKRFTATLFSSSTHSFDTQFGQTGTQFYPENSLFKSVTKNENWTSGNLNTIIEFKDFEGKLILKRTFNQTSPTNPSVTTLDTYYIYDDYGNLTYVLPPLAEGSIGGSVLQELSYQYKYDYRNRLIEKKLPGKHWEYIVYDKIDRVVATGPHISPFVDNSTTNGWMVSKYDVLNRVVYTAWSASTVDSNTRFSLQNTQNSATVINESKTASNATIDNVTTRYTNVVSPTSNFKILSINYYDDYSFPGAPTTFSTVLNDNSQAVYFNNSTIKPKGMVTGVWSRVNELTTTTPVKNLTSYLLYDRYSRVVRNYKTNHLGGYTQVDQKLDFTGKVVFSETKHKRLSTSTEILVREDFDYTPQSRLLRHKHKINNEPTQLLAKYDYDELGEVKTKRVGGTDMNNGLQAVDYQYNIRGWLTQINDITSLAKGTDPRDLFAFKINYDTVENNVNGKVTPLYNGNISEVYWRTDGDGALRKYGYQYDAINRLNEAIYQRPGTTPEVRNSYNEKITYDKNGNILTLERNGDMDDDINVLKIDQLNYSYKDNGLSNKLMKVTDVTNLSSGFKDDSNGTNDTTDDFGYDSYGNQTKDENKGITLIKYNHLNLPVEITFTGTNRKITYLYDASGIKQQKVVTNGSSVTTTDYLDGFQYVKMGSAGAVILQFFPHAEGYVSNTVVNNSNVYNYVFNYTDHLGNNRLSYAWNAQASSLTILEENHYYPYGLKHNNYNLDQEYFDALGTGVSIKPKATPYKYRFNGQEWQDELGLNSYMMDLRQYDPAIARWTVIDPVDHLSLSPYNAFDNNPVFWADPSGGDSQSLNAEFESHWGKRYDEYGNYIPPSDRGNVSIGFSNANNSEPRSVGGWLTRKIDGVTSHTYVNNIYNIVTSEVEGFVSIAISLIVSNETYGYSYFLNSDGSVTDENYNVMDNRFDIKTKGKSIIRASNPLGTFGFYNFIVGIGFTSLEYGTGVTRFGSNFTFYTAAASGRVFYGNQYVSTFSLSKTGANLGYIGAAVGLTSDVIGVYNYYKNPNDPNSVSLAKASLNTVISAYGIWGGPGGLILSLGYGTLETFYKGGTSKAIEDSAKRQIEFNRIINLNSGMAPQYIIPYGSQKF